jgi:hypothetical protein
MCSKLKKLLECNCDNCKHEAHIKQAGGGEKMYQKLQTNQQLRTTLDLLWQQAEYNRKQSEEHEKTKGCSLYLIRDKKRREILIS